ncbi:hypothetical protein VPG91_20405 [Nitrospirillum amazonense]|uniref:hypothetical protein n=1 Tax=Nitrospirillum amazonense TaxID=28077 RepID=UPI002DD43217|nr:hypothetical protein [Nitrospirillum amazonense]MEC4593377.1 hypothetical protein [Nitrospirillum amazonense]
MIKNIERINKDLARFSDQEIVITETASCAAGRGPGTIRLSTQNKCLWMKLPETPIKWTQVQKCGDSAIIEFTQTGNRLHLLEMKSKITIKEWVKTKEQWLGAYINSLALSGVLELAPFSEIILYIAYTEESITSTNYDADPVMKKVGIGKSLITNTRDWGASTTSIGLGDWRLRYVQRDSSGNAQSSLA